MICCVLSKHVVYDLPWKSVGTECARTDLMQANHKCIEALPKYGEVLNTFPNIYCLFSEHIAGIQACKVGVCANWTKHGD